MTTTCKECKYRYLCEELGHLLNCNDENKCEHYNAYLEGEEEYQLFLTNMKNRL